MAYTYEQILAKLGDEAQPVPGAIIVNRGTNVVVAEVTSEGALRITAVGEEILDSIPDVAEKPAKRSRKADTAADVSLSDLNLDEA